ncbi:hypothetical protein HAX54_013954 [Datura stramonium]|uniref:Uncharacterized protein n=1 Tax=Datura stramonium TaxID=4076 RepID=A0ABS8TM94_DATST|nr:hypothetical protein [Datura stramonium]
MVEYDIDTDETDEPRTTRAQTKSQAIVPSATPIVIPQSVERDNAQSNESENGSNAEKGSDKAQFEEDYHAPPSTAEYDHRMEALKKVKQLSSEDRYMHMKWLASTIAKDKEEAK